MKPSAKPATKHGLQIGWRCGSKGFRVVVTLYANDRSEPTVKEFDPREFLEATGLKFLYELKPDLKQILRREAAINRVQSKRSRA